MQLFAITLTKTNRALRWLCYFIFFVSILPIAIYAYKHPSYNWDMLAYMALELKMENKDIDEAHAMTYAEAKQHIPADAYDKLINGTGVRKEKAGDASRFNAELGFYIVKPLYIWISYLFYKSGFSLPMSTVLPSIIAYLLIGLLLFHWLARQHRLVFAFIASWLIMLSPFMIAVARLSTPDCLSAFLLLSAFYFVFEKPSTWILFICLVLSVMTRLDNIVVCGLLVSFLFFRWAKRISLVQYVSMIILLAGVYFLVSGMARAYNWNADFYSSLAKYLNPNVEGRQSFSIEGYMGLFYQRAIAAVLYTHFFLILLLVFLMLSSYLPGKLSGLPFGVQFCALLIVTIFIRFFLSLLVDDRLYIAYYLIILILFMQHYRRGLTIFKGKEGGKLDLA